MSRTPEARPSERLQQARKRLGKSQAEMAEALRLSVKGYQNYEQGKRELPASVIDRAQDELGISPDWLWEGKGEMFGATRTLAAKTFFLAGASREMAEGDATPSIQRKHIDAAIAVDAACDLAGADLGEGVRAVMCNLVVIYAVPSDMIMRLAQVIQQDFDRRQK